MILLMLWEWKLGKLSAIAFGQDSQKNLRILNLIYSYADVGSSVQLLYVKYCTQILIHRGKDTI